MAEQALKHDEPGSARREIVIVRACERWLGVFAEEAACVERGTAPVPLPHAPAAVLGIVSVRGRILTLLDPLALLCEDGSGLSINAPPPFILALRGEEQLALAVDDAGRLREISVDEIEPPAGEAASVVQGMFQDSGASVIILDVARLFAAAVEGLEPRRRNRILQDEK